MPARRRVSVRQMELLVEFAESHRDIVLGRFPGGPQAVQVVREFWDSVAVQLNSVAEGTTKTSDQWRRYWIEFKAKTKNKAADSRRNASATGGGPNKLVPINEIEKRVLAVIGPVAVVGLPGVRQTNISSVDETEAPADSKLAAPYPYISYPSTSSMPQSSSSVPNPISPEPPMDVEWLEEVQSPLGLQPEFSPPPSVENQPSDIADIPTQSEKQPEISSREDIRRDGARPPRWAYEMEMRRIAAEERHAAAMEALVDLMKDIRNDVHNYLRCK